MTTKKNCDGCGADLTETNDGGNIVSPPHVHVDLLNRQTFRMAQLDLCARCWEWPDNFPNRPAWFPVRLDTQEPTKEGSKQ